MVTLAKVSAIFLANIVQITTCISVCPAKATKIVYVYMQAASFHAPGPR